MGICKSTLIGGSQSTASTQDLLDWGKPPVDPPEDEKDPNELVLQSWAFCKAKHSAAKMYHTEADAARNRKLFAWRERPNFIELNCGDDSFFVSNTHRVIGIADGVGGWKKKGVDPSLFSNTLMKNAKLFAETHRKEIDPEVIMDAAYRKTIKDKEVKAGSSTACIAALRQAENGKHYLDVANLGDSGLLLVRDRRPIFRVHEKVHRFNAPFQLAVVPQQFQGRSLSDPVSACVRESIPVQKGDVVVMGTDGLFDNRFNEELAAEAGWIGHTEGTVLRFIPFIGFWFSSIFKDQQVEYVNPYRVVERLVLDTHKASLKTDGNSPWAVMLRQYGAKDAQGGKEDDVTVVLSRVTPRREIVEDSA
ncbi:unnamed protein product [Phytomonas sp. EM1]|nr:unnamed protein product [Phytomonas sp. EM1]|eukprot:CCW64329.1 unnamed protein product [Phytomonas sp. isolate EM1]